MMRTFRGNFQHFLPPGGFRKKLHLRYRVFLISVNCHEHESGADNAFDFYLHEEGGRTLTLECAIELLRFTETMWNFICNDSNFSLALASHKCRVYSYPTLFAHISWFDHCYLISPLHTALCVLHVCRYFVQIRFDFYQLWASSDLFPWTTKCIACHVIRHLSLLMTWRDQLNRFQSLQPLVAATFLQHKLHDDLCPYGTQWFEIAKTTTDTSMNISSQRVQWR